MTSVKSASERELKKNKLKTNSVQAYFPFSGAVNGLDMEGAPTDANPGLCFYHPEYHLRFDSDRDKQRKWRKQNYSVCIMSLISFTGSCVDISKQMRLSPNGGANAV